jgi:opacity protein-like surface antigen
MKFSRVLAALAVAAVMLTASAQAAQPEPEVCPHCGEKIGMAFGNLLCAPSFQIDTPLPDAMGNFPAGNAAPKVTYANFPNNTTLEVRIHDITGRTTLKYAESLDLSGGGQATYPQFNFLSGRLYKVTVYNPNNIGWGVEESTILIP